MSSLASQLYFSKEVVLNSASFSWTGRGGYGITHPGNAHVRATVATKGTEYANTKRSKRGRVAKNLLENELSHFKFVVPRDTLLENLESDDQNEASGEKFTRKVSLKRREGLMKKHTSLDQIRSYPGEVCIDVGYTWTLDILFHQLRENAEANRNPQAKKKKRERVDEIKSVDKYQPLEYVFDHPLPELLPELTADDNTGLDRWAETLFNEELGTIVPQEPIAKKQRMTKELDEIDMSDILNDVNFFNSLDSMFDSVEALELLLEEESEE